MHANAVAVSSLAFGDRQIENSTASFVGRDSSFAAAADSGKVLGSVDLKDEISTRLL